MPRAASPACPRSGAGPARWDRPRVDIVAGNDEIRTGDYLLTADGGRTITMVSPAPREYRQLTPDTFGTRLAAELRGRASFSAGSVHVEWPHLADSTSPVRGTRGAAQDPQTSPPVSRLRIARAFRLRVRLLLVRHVDLEVHETSDYGLHAARRHVPDPLASYLIADADAPTAADLEHAPRGEATEAGRRQHEGLELDPCLVVAHPISAKGVSQLVALASRR